MIRSFLSAFIEEVGIKSFLPVFTKCMKGNVTHVKNTIELIGS